MEVEEMLEEKSALQSVRSHSVMELIQNQTLRWQLLTIVVTFTALQLCGINAVSSKQTQHSVKQQVFSFFTPLVCRVMFIVRSLIKIPLL